jgi:hypothetical protein
LAQHSQYEKQKGEQNKRAFKEIVNFGEVPGLLAYVDGQPVAWCSVAPREKYSVLERSMLLKRVEKEPVWSIFRTICSIMIFKSLSL